MKLAFWGILCCCLVLASVDQATAQTSGKSFGNEVTFVTPPKLPLVSTERLNGKPHFDYFILVKAKLNGIYDISGGLQDFETFNVGQIEGLPASYQELPVADPDWDACASAEQIMTGSGAGSRHQGFQAFYSPPNDLIYLPGRQTFVDALAYYSTALHELCHWTGSTTRLGF